MKKYTCTQSCRHKNSGAGIVHGYYVMRYGGGRYTSVSYHATRAQAQAEVDRIMSAGSWSGKPPKIEADVRHKNPKRLVFGIMRDLDAEEKVYRKRAEEISKGSDYHKKAEIDRIIARYELEPDEFYTAEQKAIYIMKKRKRNPARVMSDRQALALTKRVIAYGKKLLVHERGELRRKNPIEAQHVQRFIKGIQEVGKYVVGSRPYIEALAKAYSHLEEVKKEINKKVT